MYLLDTNVISLRDPRRRETAAAFVEWMERNGAALFLSAVTLAEMEAGVLKLHRQGKTARAQQLAELIAAILADFGDRILPMDAAVARTVARLADRCFPTTIELADLIVAATADVHSLIVLTRNTRHFEPTGVAYSDPIARLPLDLAR